MADESHVTLNSEADIVTARQVGRRLAADLGFSATDQTMIATAISELARNVVQYAKRGEILVSSARKNGRSGIIIVVRDAGPGIPDLALAMQEGYSTSKGLGMGLPGTKRLMDEFEVRSMVGEGTTVKVEKWLS